MPSKVEKFFELMEYEPKPGQSKLDAWDLRRLWTFAWRRSGDAMVRGQKPREPDLK